MQRSLCYGCINSLTINFQLFSPPVGKYRECAVDEVLCPECFYWKVAYYRYMFILIFLLGIGIFVHSFLYEILICS
jgi:hypothetical protein